MPDMLSEEHQKFASGQVLPANAVLMHEFTQAVTITITMEVITPYLICFNMVSHMRTRLC